MRVRAAIIRAFLALVISCSMSTLVSIPNIQAARLTEALLRLDRMQQNVGTSFMATFIPNQVAGVNRIRITLPAGFTISSPTVSTGNLDPGVTPLPGSLSASVSGTTLTVDGVGALTSGVLYGFTGSTIITPTAGAYLGQLSSFNTNTLIEQTELALPILASDQIGITGSTTPPTQPSRCVNADFNHDHKVNIFDLSILLTRYGTNNSVGDLNGDGRVNIFDLSIFLNCFGFTY